MNIKEVKKALVANETDIGDVGIKKHEIEAIDTKELYKVIKDIGAMSAILFSLADSRREGVEVEAETLEFLGISLVERYAGLKILFKIITYPYPD